MGFSQKPDKSGKRKNAAECTERILAHLEVQIHTGTQSQP